MPIKTHVTIEVTGVYGDPQISVDERRTFVEFGEQGLAGASSQQLEELQSELLRRVREQREAVVDQFAVLIERAAEREKDELAVTLADSLDPPRAA